jgi:uncharacterized OB-fold protein
MEERIDTVEDIRQWVDSIPLRYEYTAGVAGERFFRGLMAGKILAGYCSNCRKASLPPRIYCVKCFGEIGKYVRVRPIGRVSAMTTTRSGQDGKVLDHPVTFGYITFDGVSGGILHRIVGKARVGSAVKPRFKPRRDRTGSILDIEGFER